MRDWDVRKQLDQRLRHIHAEEPLTRILPEMVVGRGVSRVDYAVVNGKLHAYEIKSDADTLERLPAQTAAYNAVFDEITIVVGPRHLATTRKTIPSWWGILAAQMSEGAVILKDLRSARRNPEQSVRGLADLLWKEEAIQLLRRSSGARGMSRKNRDALSLEISERFDLLSVADFTREALKARIGWRVDEPRTRCGGSFQPAATL